MQYSGLSSVGCRKEALAHVKVWASGTGKMMVNGRTILEHFPRIIDRYSSRYDVCLATWLKCVCIHFY
jgi:ribosomal protein S9